MHNSSNNSTDVAGTIDDWMQPADNDIGYVVTVTFVGSLTIIRLRTIVSIGIYYCCFTGDESIASRMTWQKQALGITSAFTGIFLTGAVAGLEPYLNAFGVFFYQSW